MKLSDLKAHLPHLQSVDFKLEDGSFVPEHFHVTEIGLVNRHFIDCGGIERKDQVVNFQLWDANDYEHRLKPGKLLKIIELAEERLHLPNLEIEVEYQGQTIGKYGLRLEGKTFVLTSKKTACLAQEQCGIPPSKQKLSLSDLASASAGSCTPGAGCC